MAVKGLGERYRGVFGHGDGSTGLTDSSEFEVSLEDLNEAQIGECPADGSSGVW